MMSLVHFDPSIVTVEQSFIVSQLFPLSSHSLVVCLLSPSISRLYGAGNC